MNHAIDQHAAIGAAWMEEAGQRARAASRALMGSSDAARNGGLVAMAAALRRDACAILAANGRDLGAFAGTAAFRDRLTLTAPRLEAMAAGLEQVAALPDPLARTLAEWTRPNGLHFRRVAAPIGVVGTIYESRPNVGADAAGLCLKSGNAVILRGGSDSVLSGAAILRSLRAGLRDAGLPEAAVQAAPGAERGYVAAMLGAAGLVDLLIPRGGRGLVERVQREARVPVLAHAEGLCHTYVHAAAEPAMARAVLANAKMRRTGVCGATETLLIDADCAPSLLPLLVADLAALGCRFVADARARAIRPDLPAATDADFATEWLDATLSIAVVDGLEAALAHIARYGSSHTEAIITADAAAAGRFLAGVGSAVALWNASTQFCDGGEFGFGAEIGIATGKVHARGPVGVEQLTTFRYVVAGTGQVRPLTPRIGGRPDPLPGWGDRRRTRVGLLGGSFNPAHAGHLHVARLALQRLRLNQVWLLVSPGNPLKGSRGMASLADRLESARGIADGRRILATAIECRLDTRYTFDTVRALRRRFPRVGFVWLMGADNLVQLPRWQQWTGIARTMPFAVMPRPSYNQRALAGQAAHRLRRWLRDPRQAPSLARLAAPAWTFLPARQDPSSATAIRERGTREPRHAWPRPALATSPLLQRRPVLATTRA